MHKISKKNQYIGNQFGSQLKEKKQKGKKM